MAAPPEITITNLSGKYIMNSTLTDDIDAMLTLQNLNWLVRSAIYYTTVVLSVHQHTSPTGVLLIDQTSVAAGVSTSVEKRILDWEARAFTNPIFGAGRGQSRLIRLADFVLERDVGDQEDGAFLRGQGPPAAAAAAEADDGGQREAAPREGEGAWLGGPETELVHAYVLNTDDLAGGGWTGEMVWGFELVNGERRHTRRAVVRTKDGSQVQRVRLVYDYKGPLDSVPTAEGDPEAEAEDALAYGEEVD